MTKDNFEQFKGGEAMSFRQNADVHMHMEGLIAPVCFSQMTYGI